MQPATKSKNESFANVLKRLRENARLTTRQAASIVGVTHTTISHFENGKRAVEGFRVEQMVRAYGYTMEQFDKIAGNKTVLSFKDDCVSMIGFMDDEQLAAIRAVMSQMLRLTKGPRRYRNQGQRVARNSNELTKTKFNGANYGI